MKAEPLLLTVTGIAIKTTNYTPQGQRDQFLMCLLLDHGLRVGEAAGLRIKDIDLQAGTLSVYRPKVDKLQIHRLSHDSLQAARQYIHQGMLSMRTFACLIGWQYKKWIPQGGH